MVEAGALGSELFGELDFRFAGVEEPVWAIDGWREWWRQEHWGVSCLGYALAEAR
jgi:hypothetical protein